MYFITVWIKTIVEFMQHVGCLYSQCNEKNVSQEKVSGSGSGSGSGPGFISSLICLLAIVISLGRVLFVLVSFDKSINLGYINNFCFLYFPRIRFLKIAIKMLRFDVFDDSNFVLTRTNHFVQLLYKSKLLQFSHEFI